MENEPGGWTYKKSGLDLDAYAGAMAGIAPLLARTWDARVRPPAFPGRKSGKGSGGFASLFDLNPDGKYQRPLLVTCTDGVGSKLKVAQALARFDTVGIDLVAMSVNDLICTGAEPLVFLDYIALPKDDAALTLAVVSGISAACAAVGCALAGGETAILPDSYQPGDFDLAGFCAGVVEADAAIDGTQILPGDVLLGLPSSGLHSNGYTLARRVVEVRPGGYGERVGELGGTLGEALLTPTRLYVRDIQRLLAGVRATGLANVTGGGVPDNLARILPDGCGAVVRRGSWPAPPIFDWLRRAGNVTQPEMDRVFNGGVGFVVVVRPGDVAAARALLPDASVIGEVVPDASGGEPTVVYAE